MKYTKCSTNYRYIWYLIVWKLWNYEFIGKFDFFIDWKLLRFIITLFFLVGLDRMRCQDFHIQCSLKKLGRNWADCTIFKYSFFMVRLIRSKLHLLDSDRSPFFLLWICVSPSSSWWANQMVNLPIVWRRSFRKAIRSWCLFSVLAL